MTAIPVSPLLLDNEKLREIMREREQCSPAAAAAHQPATIRQLIKPELLSGLATIQPSSIPAGNGPWLQQHWPTSLRQLHWELCSSTQLRPIARIMDRTALLPDPFVRQGGLWHVGEEPLPITATHPDTQLFTALRLDLVVWGHCIASIPDQQAVTLYAGDALLVDALCDIRYTCADNTALLWTTLYYSPNACCCKSMVGTT